MLSIIKKCYQDEETFRAVVLLLIGGGIFLAAVWNFANVLGPFLAAIVLAALLNSVVTRLQKCGIPRFVGAGVLIITLVALLSVILMIFLFFLQKYIAYCASHIPATLEFLANWIPQKLHRLNEVTQQFGMPFALDAENIRVTILQSMGSLAEAMVRYAGSVYTHAKSLVGVLSFLFFVPILTFYLLKDWPHVVVKTRFFLSERWLAFLDFAGPQAKQTLKKQINGQFKVSLVIFVLYSVGLSLIGMSAFLFLGFLSAALTFIPFIGIFIAFVVAFAVGFSQGLGPASLLAIAVLYFLGSSLESNFLTPRFVGKKIGLHPVWIFFAVLMTLACLGLGGAFFVMPIASLVWSLIQSTLQWIKMQEQKVT